MKSLTVQGSPFEMSSNETLPLGLDVSGLIDGDEPPGSLGVTLVRIDTGEPVPDSLSGSVSLEGNVIIQAVTGLSPGIVYALRWTFTVSGKTYNPQLIIKCEY